MIDIINRRSIREIVRYRRSFIMKIIRKWRKSLYAAIFLVANIAAFYTVYHREAQYIRQEFQEHAQDSQQQLEAVMKNYIHSFRLFEKLMAQQIENQPDPDALWDYLKVMDGQMKEIEGDTFDGIYMYYKDRYLYSWDTPYEEYERSGYDATTRPWYQNAIKGKGEIVFTPPYMSYANHYILSTISSLQPDGKTVFAYDIKMGDIQDLVKQVKRYDEEEVMIFDKEGTIIGCTITDYLGGNLYAQPDETKAELDKVNQDIAQADQNKLDREQKAKLEEQATSLKAYYAFHKDFKDDFTKLSNQVKQPQRMRVNGTTGYAYLLPGEDYSFLLFIPATSILTNSMNIWLVPLLILELALIYVLSRISKAAKNHELKMAYIELGQTQKRLEIALSAAQKAAAIDDLTGMMNFKSFRRNIQEHLEDMDPDESGILIMMDGDHFKTVNDTYGHQAGDEVIKLCAQMIVGRIRTVDYASRLHGDEYAIFITKTDDYDVAKKIVDDINTSIRKEAKRRNMPIITLSAGAVIARTGDTYSALAKIADTSLYEAKKTHDGGFARAPQ